MKILLGITGSISAYKSIDLARGLQSRGHEVKVVLSKGSLNFLNPSLFKYLGIESFLPEADFAHTNVLHIDLARWAEMIAIVPLSANTLSKLSSGACDDLLTSVWLSARPNTIKVIAPAMNSFMLDNSITKNSLAILKNQGVHLISPDSGMLACGDVGEGKLPKVETLIEVLECTSNCINDKNVIVTAGATLSNIDTVRFVTNPARGGSAFLIAKKYLKEGYKVHVIKGHDVIKEFSALKKHPRYSEESVVTTQDLLATVTGKDFDIYISPMAVSDLEFKTAGEKLKKSALNKALPFTQAPDVLKYVVTNRKPHQQIVGFAAESTLSDKVINEKIARKPVDLLVANLADGGFVSGKAQGFGTTHGTYKLVTPNERKEYVNLSKKDLADLIFEKIK